jgi:hypothetical protein
MHEVHSLTNNTAVLIGCAPTFAAIIRGRLLTRPSYDTQGYVKHSPSNEVKLQTIGSANSRPKPAPADDNVAADTFWDEQNSSQVELAKSGEMNGREQKGIVVTTTVQSEDARASGTAGLVRNVPKQIVRER